VKRLILVVLGFWLIREFLRQHSTPERLPDEDYAEVQEDPRPWVTLFER
jgi:hypothetical protein